MNFSSRFWTRHVALFTPILSASILVAGCDLQSFGSDAEEESYDISICGSEMRIPKSYFVVPPNFEDPPDAGFIVAAWPGLYGRPTDGEAYAKYAASNIGMLVTYNDCKRPYSEYIEKKFVDYTQGDAPSGRPRPPVERLDDWNGFEHFRRQRNERERRGFGAKFPHIDIFIRRDAQGHPEALITCDGGTFKSGRHPQCDMLMVYPDNPALHFDLNLNRDPHLEQVREIEPAIIALFRKFEAAAANNR